jgi:tripartite-type tricarboxylate transporter receptor subunit TctC
MLTRRTALGGLLSLGAGLGTGLAPRSGKAQTFPSRTVTVVVPYPAGGPVDAVARLYADEAAADLGHPVTVDNRGGGGGTIGTVAVARADPDGHTLVLGTNQTHATNQSLLKNCPYDGVADFAPVAGLTVIPHMLVARKSLQVKSVAELVDGARKMPDAMNYGSTGVGSASHLTAELFKTVAGVDIRHIPFRGAAPMTTELIAERLDIAFATLPSVINFIEAGELKALAVASAKRAERLPDVPTLKEAGFAGVEADAWFALFAPGKTPPPVIDRLYRSVTIAFGKAKTKEAIAKQGMTLALTPPAEFAAALPAEVKKWAEVIKAAHVSVE